jgi:hypothetical protein
MSEIIRCPDCGGIVGATQVSDQGFPCTCFQKFEAHESEDESSGTKVMASPSKQKVCCMCGKDLSGKKRLKDSIGYWCPECAKEDNKKKEVHGTKCENCGRVVPEQSMTSVDGKKMCSRCVREQRQLRAPGNKKFRAISDGAYKEHEKRNMVIMAVVLVILVILMIVAWQRRPWAQSRANDAHDAIGAAYLIAPIEYVDTLQPV